MHIVIAIASAIGAILFFIIRVGMAARAAKELGGAASDAVGAVRRARFRRKTTRSPLTQLEDPREAVAALMVAISKTEGDLTSEQIDTMKRLIADRLAFDDPAELLAHARWLTHEAAEPGVIVQRVSSFLASNCNEEQKADIIAVLTEVAEVDGPPSPIQQQTINHLKNNLGMRKSH